MTVLPLNIFDFWKEKSEEYSALLKVANHALCVLASSAPVERIFSADGLIMRPHRARFFCNMLEMLVYLKCKFGFLEKLMSFNKITFFYEKYSGLDLGLDSFSSWSQTLGLEIFWSRSWSWSRKNFTVSVSVSNHVVSTLSLVNAIFCVTFFRTRSGSGSRNIEAMRIRYGPGAVLSYFMWIRSPLL